MKLPEISKWSLLLFAGGIFTIVISTVRWFFLYPDMSQFGLACIIGVILCAFGYIYDWMKIKERKIVQLEEKLDTLLYPPIE